MGLKETILGWMHRIDDREPADAEVEAKIEAEADAEIDDTYPAYRAAAADELAAQVLGGGPDAFDADQSAPPR